MDISANPTNMKSSAGEENFQDILSRSVKSLSRRDISTMQGWLSEHLCEQDLMRTAVEKVLVDFMDNPSSPAQNMIYMLHEVLMCIRKIDQDQWRGVIGKVMDFCSPLVEFRHRDKILERVLKIWMHKKIITQCDEARWAASLNVRPSSGRVIGVATISSIEWDSVLKYMDELLRLIFEAESNKSRSQPADPLVTPNGERGGQGKIGIAGYTGPSSGGVSPMAAHSSGMGQRSTGMTTGQRSTGLHGSASSGGQRSVSRGGGDEQGGQGINADKHGSVLALTLSSYWVLHDAFRDATEFFVDDLYCLVHGSILLAGKSEHYFIRLSKILTAAEILWHRHKSQAAEQFLSTLRGDSSVLKSVQAHPAKFLSNAFPYHTGSILEAETFLLKGLGYVCSGISRPDRIFESWSLKRPCLVDVDILADAQRRLTSESHWLRSDLVLQDETVISLGYIVVIMTEKAHIQQVDVENFKPSGEFKAIVKLKAPKIIAFICDLDPPFCKELAVEYVQRLSSMTVNMNSEVSERKHSVKLRNFFVDGLSSRVKAIGEIKLLFSKYSRCINVAKVEDCNSCAAEICGCYLLSFENSDQASKSLELNNFLFSSEKLVLERVAEKHHPSYATSKDPRRQCVGTELLKPITTAIQDKSPICLQISSILAKVGAAASPGFQATQITKSDPVGISSSAIHSDNQSLHNAAVHESAVHDFGTSTQTNWDNSSEREDRNLAHGISSSSSRVPSRNGDRCELDVPPEKKRRTGNGSSVQHVGVKHDGIRNNDQYRSACNIARGRNGHDGKISPENNADKYWRENGRDPAYFRNNSQLSPRNMDRWVDTKYCRSGSEPDRSNWTVFDNVNIYRGAFDETGDTNDERAAYSRSSMTRGSLRSNTGESHFDDHRSSHNTVRDRGGRDSDSSSMTWGPGRSSLNSQISSREGGRHESLDKFQSNSGRRKSGGEDKKKNPTDVSSIYGPSPKKYFECSTSFSGKKNSKGSDERYRNMNDRWDMEGVSEMSREKNLRSNGNYRFDDQSRRR